MASLPNQQSSAAAADTRADSGLVAPINDSSNITRLLSFWFDHPDGVAKWFKTSPTVDAECQIWAPLVEAARAGALAGWAQTPDGTLALLLLLDQLPRNVYRGTAAAFASDSAALEVAVDAVARGDDRRVALDRQLFFYLPLMHSESLLAQVGCLGLYQGMAARAEPGTAQRELCDRELDIAQAHVDVIRRFGRFPGRNAALGRESTTEELEYLRKNGPWGF